MGDYAIPAAWANEPQGQPQMVLAGGVSQQQQQMPQQIPQNPFAGIKPQIHITVKDQNGQEHTFDETHLMNDIAQNGATPTGVSADGLTITFQGSKGPYQAPVTDVLAKMGYNSVGIKPIEAGEDHVSNEWRAAITKLPDDDAKQAYLTAKLKREGEIDPKVYGSGRDWYAYSPNLGQWLALTNTKGWDSGDLLEGALEGTRMVGSAVGAGVGGALGAAAGGIGAVPGSMAGAAIAGGGVDALERGIIAASDEDYRDSAGLGSHLASLATGAGLDAATAGTFGAIGKYGAPALKSLVQSGPLSTMARTVGGGLNWGGKSIAGAASKLNSTELGRDVAAAFIPGASQLQNAGILAQLPSQALTKGASALRSLGTSEAAQNIFGEEAMQGVGRAGSSLLRNRSPEDLAGNFANVVRKGLHGSEPINFRPVNASDVSTNLGEKIGQAITKDPEATLGYSLTKNPADEARAAYQNTMAGTSSENNAKKVASRAFRDAQRQRLLSGVEGAAKGQQIGDAIEGLNKAGEALNSGARGIAATTLYGATGAGRAAQGVGAALGTAGKIGQPLENYLYARGLSEDAIHDNVMNRVGPKVDKYFNFNRRPNPVKKQPPTTFAYQGDY